MSQDYIHWLRGVDEVRELDSGVTPLSFPGAIPPKYTLKFSDQPPYLENINNLITEVAHNKERIYFPEGYYQPSTKWTPHGNTTNMSLLQPARFLLR